ncbi:MAG: F0F1 ATP synthase subunit delta [Gammaproteobacteria bacterium]|jgi:F-type H+-transporting ATPase subunit b
MEINWSTFILEIINFLVLVWILKYFLYTPIKKVISQRKTSIQKELDEANKTQENAKALQNKYENRLLEWEKEKEQSQINFQHEMEKEKTKKLTDLANALKNEREKNAALEKRRIDEIINQKEKESIARATKFSATMLAQVSCPELENKIIDLFLDDLNNLPKEKTQAMKHEIGNQEICKINTAYQLLEEKKNTIISAIQKQFGDTLSFEFKLDPKLLGGIYIELGSIVFHANLRDELKYFAEATHRE